MDEWIRRALEEDVGAGDVTTESIVPVDQMAAMQWVARSEMIVCGLFVAERVFTLLDPETETASKMEEGGEAGPGDVILELAGKARTLLVGERVALNITQHLCGVAGKSRRFAKAVVDHGAVVAATRKTLPHLRRLQKYAVTIGGAAPHRYGLDDGVLIKDNHVAMAGSIAKAVALARARAHHLLKIEVEVTNMDEVEEALEAGADLLLLDNMTPKQLRQAVEFVDGEAILEASGNVTLENIAEIAATGVDIISSGALTHSVAAADISARMKPYKKKGKKN